MACAEKWEQINTLVNRLRTVDDNILDCVIFCLAKIDSLRSSGIFEHVNMLFCIPDSLMRSSSSSSSLSSLLKIISAGKD